MNDLEILRVGPRDWTLLEEVARLERDAFGEEALSPGLLALFAQSAAIFALRSPVAGQASRDGDSKTISRSLVAEALVLSNLDDTGALLFSLAVDRDHRRHGFGRRLLESVFPILRSSGRTYLRLTVDPENRPARSLYLDRLGFRQVDEIADCLGPGKHRLLLHRDLT